MLKHVPSIRILHGYGQILLRQEDLFELDDVRVHHQAMIQDLPFHISCDSRLSSLYRI